MANLSRIIINIADGGTGRQAAGKDWYSGIIFQNASLPAGYGTDNIKRIYSLSAAEALGITEALFPVEHYQISEFFRVLAKYNTTAWWDVGIYPIVTDAYDAAQIPLMQTNANGELRQIGVFLVDTYVDTFLSDSDAEAVLLDNDGLPTAIYLAADVADTTVLADSRLLGKKWAGLLCGQDGAGTGAALYVSEGYSIAAIGVQMAITVVAKVHEWVGRGIYDVAGSTELQEPALVDGLLVKNVTKAAIDLLDAQGYTVIVDVPNLPGAYFYTDSQTASLSTSDFKEQSANRTAIKAKRLMLIDLAPARNAPLYVDPATGFMTEDTIQYLTSLCEISLNNMAKVGNINIDQNTGRIPANSVTIDPDQDVISQNAVLITAKMSKVGAAGEITVSLGFAVTIT